MLTLDGRDPVRVGVTLEREPPSVVGRPAPARSRSKRKADTLEKLRTEVDLWVASASSGSPAHLVPLSYQWDGARLTLATPRASPTARNLIRAGRARVALGPTRDVVIIEGHVEAIPIGTSPELEEDTRGRPASTHEPCPRSTSTSGSRPQEIQAWREDNELKGRHLMRRGDWLD